MSKAKISFYRVCKPGQEDLNRTFGSKKDAKTHAINYARLGFSPRAGRYIGKSVGGAVYIELVRCDGTVEKVDN
jgi:hypothetical protein